VIDVHGWVTAPSVHHEVDEGFERNPLLWAAVGPPRPELGFTMSISMRWIPDSKEVFEPIVLREWVALDVEEEIAGRRFG